MDKAREDDHGVDTPESDPGPPTGERAVSLEAAGRAYRVIDFAEVPGVPCPCGTARRAFADVADFPGTIHVTEISADAKLHHHRTLTETYYVLESEQDARMQLDDHIIPVGPGVCVMIPPGVRHRAIGRMKVLIVVVPKFDPADEWLD